MLGAIRNMKRLLLLLLLVMMAAWFTTTRHVHVQTRPETFRALDAGHRSSDRARQEAQRATSEAQHEVQRALAEARQEVQQALRQAGHEVREALHEAHREVREALAEADQEVRESVDGIPVPIVAGTRAVEALVEPPTLQDLPEQPLAAAPAQPAAGAAPPLPPAPPGFPGLVQHPGSPRPPASPAPSAPPRQKPAMSLKPEDTRVIKGLISATEDRAREEARKELDKNVAEWLEASSVPRSWQPPAQLVDGMILETKVKPIVKDYGTLHEAEFVVDVSPRQRANLVAAYHRQLVHGRLVLLGGTLTFFLTCLAAITGYIRADEVTKGYYTNRLRLIAAAGVGAAGVLIYQMVV